MPSHVEGGTLPLPCICPHPETKLAACPRHSASAASEFRRKHKIPECFFAHLGGCEGRLVKAHLIPKQRIRRELRSQRALAYDSRIALERGVDEAVWDSRCWTWMCGGISGLGGHHGAFDVKQIEIARDELPGGVEDFAREYGLAWSLEADYGLPSNFVEGAKGAG